MQVVLKKTGLPLKKTLNYLKVKAEKNSGQRVFFFDEARFGLQTRLTKVRAMSGKPFQVKVKQDYEGFYVYGSVEQKTGKNFSLFLTRVNTKMMNQFNWRLVIFGHKEVSG